jgi:hypothetical protein
MGHLFVGLDVAKHRVEGHVRPTDETFSVLSASRLTSSLGSSPASSANRQNRILLRR